MKIDNHLPLVFLDIETTGASARTSRITEIGAIRVENGKVVSEFRQLVNPEEPVPPFISRMTGIHDEMLWDAPLFAAIADQLEVFLDGALFIAHNVTFDYGFIKSEFERIGQKFSMDRACTVRLSRLLHPEHRSHRLDLIIERMNVEVTNRHRAYDDAEVLWKFFQEEYQTHGENLFDHLHKVTSVAR
jgi:DNA polymerase-3 subunit epsilon